MVLPAGTSDLCFSRVGHNMRVAVFLQPQPQRPMVPIDTLPCDPGSWDARIDGALQHLLPQLWLGRKEALRWHPRALVARCVSGPLCGEIAFPIEPDLALGTRRGQKHPNLPICHRRRLPCLCVDFCRCFFV